jgi:REP element-mobilizing transposase RayT
VIYPNYIRLDIVLHTPNLAPAQLMYHLKRTTSRIVCLEYPSIQRRLKSLWTRSYLISTDENLTEEQIMRYVATQRGR